MQVYVSNREIEQIAEGLVHVACGKPPPKRIDIDAVAVYLGLTVRYKKFAESDQDKIGFTSDGKSALTVFRNGQKQRIIFPKETIVLDSFLQYPCESSRRRFTLAHEISHILINRADPTHTAPCFNRVYDMQECQAILRISSIPSQHRSDTTPTYTPTASTGKPDGSS